ncbi:hypothetical protein Fot_36335 [Forsythia ovata]|uniref:Uncharacterized protein n=1 Tax=Forsythia ovata TaxID=205694 RepID=A0ABD1SP62_9LAMI
MEVMLIMDFFRFSSDSNPRLSSEEELISELEKINGDLMTKNEDDDRFSTWMKCIRYESMNEKEKNRRYRISYNRAGTYSQIKIKKHRQKDTHEEISSSIAKSEQERSAKV